MKLVIAVVLSCSALAAQTIGVSAEPRIICGDYQRDNPPTLGYAKWVIEALYVTRADCKSERISELQWIAKWLPQSLNDKQHQQFDAAMAAAMELKNNGGERGRAFVADLAEQLKKLPKNKQVREALAKLT